MAPAPELSDPDPTISFLTLSLPTASPITNILPRSSFLIPEKPKKLTARRRIPRRGRHPGGGRQRRRASWLLWSGLLWYSLASDFSTVFGAPSQSHASCVRGAAAGCLSKGYEHKKPQSLGLWDTCLALSNQSNESEICRRTPRRTTSDHIFSDLIGSGWTSEESGRRTTRMPTPATAAALGRRGSARLLRSSVSFRGNARVMETGTCCADSRAITANAGKHTGFADRVERQRRSVSTLVLL